MHLLLMLFVGATVEQKLCDFESAFQDRLSQRCVTSLNCKGGGPKKMVKWWIKRQWWDNKHTAHGLMVTYAILNKIHCRDKVNLKSNAKSNDNAYIPNTHWPRLWVVMSHRYPPTLHFTLSSCSMFAPFLSNNFTMFRFPEHAASMRAVLPPCIKGGCSTEYSVRDKRDI